MASARVNILTPQQKTARTVAALAITSNEEAIDFLDAIKACPDSGVIVINDDSPELSAHIPKEPQISPRAERRKKEQLKKRLKQRARTRIQARPCPNGRQRQFQRSVRSLR